LGDLAGRSLRRCSGLCHAESRPVPQLHPKTPAIHLNPQMPAFAAGGLTAQYKALQVGIPNVDGLLCSGRAVAPLGRPPDAPQPIPLVSPGYPCPLPGSVEGQSGQVQRYQGMLGTRSPAGATSVAICSVLGCFWSATELVALSTVWQPRNAFGT
jgi:hypothetical protein